MNKKLLLICVIVGLIAAVWFSLSVANHSSPTSSSASIASDVTISTPQQHDFAKTCRWFGRVNSTNQTSVISQLAGTISQITVADNQPVVAGEILFTLGGAWFTNNQQSINKQLKLITQRIDIAQQQLKIKRTMLKEKLVNRAQLLSTLDSLLSLQNQQQQLIHSQQQLLEASHIRAGSNGVFTGRKVSVGQRVQKDQSLANIIGTKQRYIQATLYTQQCGAILLGKQATITLDSTQPTLAKVTHVLPQLTNEGATVVWLNASPLPATLKPGELVTGQILLLEHKHALAVPLSALMSDVHEQSFVMLKQGDRYHQQLVQTGMIDNGWQEIISGITATDKVVVEGAYELFHRNFNQSYKVAD